MFDEYKPGRSFSSAEAGQLVIPRLENKQGEMAFSHSFARCWHQLTMEIRPTPSVASFKKKLKKSAFFSAAINSSRGSMFIFVILV